MDMLDVSVTLIVKAPNQQIEDQTIKCDTTWSIRKLKGHLAEVYPSKPRTEDQKLIYSGQLLTDTVILKDVLRQYEGQDTHTVHLVCSASRESALKRSAALSNPRPARMSEAVRQDPPADPPGSADEASASAIPDTSTDGIRQRLSASSIPARPPQAGGFPAQADPRAAWMAAMAQPYPAGAPGVAYDPNAMTQQILYMQQAYAQYMAQYMQMVAANSAQGFVGRMGTVPTTPPQPAPENPPPENRDRPEQAIPDDNPNIPDGEEEENRGNRDWLDWVYILSRVMVLFSIVYFYSSPTRFIMVSALGALMYLYQVGFFRAQQILGAPVAADNNNHAGGAQAADDRNLRAPAPAENADAANEEDDSGSESDEAGAGESGTEERPQPEERPALLALTWTFVSTFFASLIPEQPGV